MARISDWGPYQSLEQHKAQAGQSQQLSNITTLSNLQVKAATDEYNRLKGQADTSGQLAAQFLSSWGGAMQNLQGMFGDATSVIKGLISGTSGGGTGGIGDLSKMMTDSYKEYKATYEPMAKEFLSASREQLGQKQAITKELVASAKPDYAGVTGRAYADVMTKAEQQNAEATRKMMSYGVDPSGGAFGALSRRGAVDTAGMAASAMNQARVAEKNRSTALSKDLMGLINPNETASIGTDLLSKQNEMLTKAGALKQSEMQTMSTLGQAMGNLATGYSNAIAQPYSELAGYYIGKSGGAINPTQASSLSMTPQPNYYTGPATAVSKQRQPEPTPAPSYIDPRAANPAINKGAINPYAVNYGYTGQTY
jgi:hypothetical protein